MVNWEPDEQTVAHYEEALQLGVSKNDIMLQLLHLPEAVNIYSHHPTMPEEKRQTVAQRIQYLLVLSDDEFVRELYWELFYREAEPRSYELQLNAMTQGVSRLSLISRFLYSEEWNILLTQRHVFSMRILAHFLRTL